MTNETERKEMTRRFNIIKGQIEGINKMINEDSDCMKIITQIKAVKSGFNKMGEEFIKKYLKECNRKKDGDYDEKNFEKALSVLANY